MKLRKPSRLLVQIGVKIVIFFLIAITLLSIAMYRGCLAIFLKAKNDFLYRDMSVVREDILKESSLDQVLD